MSVGYVAVQWNRHKRVYDAVLLGVVALYVTIFYLAGKALYTGRHAISDEILILRAVGTCAFVLLHVVMCIGPLARLDRRVLPLLYNRRHLGVTTFVMGLAHGGLALGYYHGFGVVSPFVSLLASNTNFGTLSAFPFQILGLLALLILALMAATSHDFWLKNLGASTWKWLHMLVYLAYGLLVLHVALGILQTHRSVWLAALVAAGAVLVCTLHLVAARKETRHDARRPGAARSVGWVDACGLDEIDEGCGRTVALEGAERIALVRHNGCISALANTCAHQGGPLGEGRIIDGCVTCPWHGWQYRPADGQSPPPFTERIATYRVRVVRGRIEVDPAALPAGTPVEPARVEGGAQ